ncbi:MAG: DUF998 domain-containing protein [Chloroflexi bacterium]|nr:DUF998 domain-containing protein [Chloroflexota bacterium]
MQDNFENERSLVFSYLQLRKAIGLMGIALPIVVPLGARFIFKIGMLSSISAYYHTGMRNVLVGTLFAIAYFLLSYKGYEGDAKFSKLAWFFALGLALFPTEPDGATDNLSMFIGTIHLIFGVLFFLTLIYFSLFLFTKTDLLNPPTHAKMQRNKVYRACAYLMIVCILLIVLYYLLPSEIAWQIAAYNPIYWLETIIILAFGISWFTKGEAILKDELDLEYENELNKTLSQEFEGGLQEILGGNFVSNSM